MAMRRGIMMMAAAATLTAAARLAALAPRAAETGPAAALAGLASEPQTMGKPWPEVVMKWDPDADAGAAIREKARLAGEGGGVIAARDRGFVGVFLHIHKGGGTTVCTEAIRHGETSRLGMNCNLRGPEAQAGLVAADPAAQAGILADAVAKEGLTFIANEWVLPAQVFRSARLRYLTLLRDPVRRTESHFAYSLQQQLRSKQRPRRFSGAQLNCSRGASDEVLQLAREARDRGGGLAHEARARVAWLTRVPDNWQVRALCGMECASVPFGGLNEHHLRLASRRLESDFDVVGILEYFSQSLDLFAQALEWPSAGTTDPTYARRSSEASFFDRVDLHGDPQMSAQDEQDVREALTWFDLVNAWDAALYKHALALLYRALDARGVAYEKRQAFRAGHLTWEEARGELSSRAADCKSQCCHATSCAHIGVFWTAAARRLGLVPTTSCG